MSYLDGSICEPGENDPLYPIWDANNSIVMSLLVNSMTDKIQNNYLSTQQQRKSRTRSIHCIPTRKIQPNCLNYKIWLEI